MPKPNLRTPDGKIQMKSIDDLLKEAATEDALLNIPGKGKPLNLRDYFTPGEEFRVAGKILKENQVLPPHLQERKDAENLQEAALVLLTEAQNQIPHLRQEILSQIQAIVAIFPNRATCQEWLCLEIWPEDYPEPESTAYTLKEIRQIAPQIEQNINRYNARIRNITYRYMSLLKEAQENIQNYHKRQLLNTTLSPNYNYLAPIDLETKEQEIQNILPPLPELPPDISNQLKRWHKTTQPSMWTRFLTQKIRCNHR